MNCTSLEYDYSSNDTRINVTGAASNLDLILSKYRIDDAEVCPEATLK